MKTVYCSHCGLQLHITRRALPKYGRIIDLVDHHICSEDPVKIDWEVSPVPAFAPSSGQDKFVQKLTELDPPKPLTFDSDLKDRRSPEHVKSTAPPSVTDMLKGMIND